MKISIMKPTPFYLMISLSFAVTAYAVEPTLTTDTFGGASNVIATVPEDNLLSPIMLGTARHTDALAKEWKNRARYRFADVPFKPYVDELRTPSGKNILRDAPHDHLHHHALMYAIRVDGNNFWEENDPRAGKQKTVQIRVSVSNIEAEIDWNTFESKTLLKETRKISVNQEHDATFLDWQSTLKAVNDAELGGGHYHGLGLRFLEEMDKNGRFFSDSDKNEKEIVRGDEALTRCRWMAYTANLVGTPVTVAIFDHLSNPVPMTAFTMGDAGGAFAYLSATMNLHRVPVNLKGNESFVTRYRVAVWDGEQSRETVEKAYKAWDNQNRAP